MTKTSKNIFILIIILLIISLCIYAFSDKKSMTPTPAPVQTASVAGCYVAKLSKDVYTLKIESENNGAVTGRLAFNNYEKDSSSGTFTGTLSGDILLGTYSFDSEGMHSNRQVIFKKVGDSFIEGFGDVKVVGDTETLTDPNTVTYDPKSTFVKSTECTS